MSGVCGVVRFDGADVAPREIDRMAQAMRHRGSDSIDTVELGRLALGHCLLRVNREDVHEAQPIVERDAVLVADLRLDNREQLAVELEIDAAALSTMPDSEVLLRAWRRWGNDCAAHLLGDFVFAIWDRAKGTLLLARDHMGQRPVHYHLGAGFFAFASDLPGLFGAKDVPQRINEDELVRRLLKSTERVEGESIYADIHSLTGGTTLRLDRDGTTTIARYWEPHAGVEHRGQHDGYYLAAYRTTIEEAVACRLRRLIDPPALLFSGGFDSGIIAAVGGPIMAAQGCSLHCFTSVLREDDPRRDSRAMAKAFRDRPGLDLRFYVRGSESAYDDLEASFDRTRRPQPPSIVRRRIGAMAKQAGSRLILDGHGGDYTVNPYGAAMLGAILRGGEVTRFAREFRARMRFTGWSPLRVFGRDVLSALMPQRPRMLWRRAVSGLTPAWQRRGARLDFVHKAFASGSVDPASLRDGYRPGLRWRARWIEMCRQAAANGTSGDYSAAVDDMVLSRPFQDKRIVELGCALPDHLLFRDGQERWLARQAFANELPPSLIARMPGNAAEQPDKFVMDADAAPAMLAALDAVKHDDAVARYIDVNALTDILKKPASDTKLSDRIRLGMAMQTLTTAHFLAWLDRSNR